MPTAQQEIEQGRRFPFGANWAAFLRTLDDDRIAIAEQSLLDLLNTVRDEEAEAEIDGKTQRRWGHSDDGNLSPSPPPPPVPHLPLAGCRFLDVGCGSGLFSLAARRLGARVHSFDFDPQSVACAEELSRRYFPDDDQWTIEPGSALDADYLNELGEFDVVYSWGVLHHTGNMWQALENVSRLVRPGGVLAIALYNDQGCRSRMWLRVKQLYCRHVLTRWLILLLFVPWFFLRTVAVSLIRRRNAFREYRRNRGMSIVHDWLDWLGGLPFEVAGVEEVAEFFRQRGFELRHVTRTRRLGNNEFVFVRQTGERGT
jgi:2-polyprenyl-3-methyl-5-hydroxy-6-metoxy-1,4-benzoquinol methylase